MSKLDEPTTALMIAVDQSAARLRAADAEYVDALAAGKRAAAEAANDRLFVAQHHAEAAGLEALAGALRDPASQGYPTLYRGNGGEVTPADDSDLPWNKRRIAQEVQGHAGALAADASLERLKLADVASGLPLALETAQDPKAVETLLAHQLAAAHVLAMKLLTAADRDVTQYGTNRKLNPETKEPVRNAHAAAKVLDAFARGALALDRLRNGSRQTIVVVKDGGQAVVAAGNFTTGVNR